MPRHVTERPMPRHVPGARSAHDQVVEDLALLGLTEVTSREAIEWVRARAAVGLESYGQPLTRDNGRNTREDAIEEVADLVAYLRVGVDEGWCRAWTYRSALGVFADLLAGYRGRLK